MPCLFCNVVKKTIPADIVYEDDAAVAFRDIRPVAPSHILVVPREHINAVHDMTERHVETMGRVLLAARNVSHALGFDSAGYRLVINDGADAGQTVHHVHVHILAGRALGWPPG